MTSVLKKGFLWGGSASSMQTEGAWNEGGKGPSVYDNPKEMFARHSDWKVAVDFYHRYKEDIALMAGMGFTSYRFSLSWARIIPDGDGAINEEGLQFYENVVNELLRNGIEAFIALHHFDLPLALVEKYGGWHAREVYEAYKRYAEIVIKRFGSRVKLYIPFNEQNGMTVFAEMEFPKEITSNERQKLQALSYHHLFMSSAAVCNLVHEISPESKVGGMINFTPCYPETCKPGDILAAQRLNQLGNFDFLDIFAYGKYPVAKLNEWKRNNVNPVVPGDLEYLARASMDFLSHSFYQSIVVNETMKNPTALFDSYNGKAVSNPYLEESEWGWKIDPVALRLVVKEMYDRYQLPVFTIECGIGVAEELDENNTVIDDYRIQYFQDHLEQLKLAVKEDGVDLMGFLTWGPIDILSSQGEMKKRYGFVYVNRTDTDLKDLKRYKKKSYDWFKRVIETNGEFL